MCYAERKKAGSKNIIWCHPMYDFSQSTFWESENQGTEVRLMGSFGGDGNIL